MLTRCVHKGVTKVERKVLVRLGANSSVIVTLIAQYWNQATNFVNGLLENDIADENHFTPVKAPCIVGDSNTIITCSSTVINNINEWALMFDLRDTTFAAFSECLASSHFSTSALFLKYSSNVLRIVNEANVTVDGTYDTSNLANSKFYIISNGTDAKLHAEDGTLLDTLIIDATLKITRLLNIGTTVNRGFTGKPKEIQIFTQAITYTYSNVVSATPDYRIIFEKYLETTTTPVYPCLQESGVTFTLSGHDASNFSTYDDFSDASVNGFNLDSGNIIPASSVIANIGKDVTGADLVYGTENSQGVANLWKVVNPTQAFIDADTEFKFVDGSGVPKEVNFTTFTDAVNTDTTKDGNDSVDDLKVYDGTVPVLPETYYVAESGTVDGAGTIGDPWNLAKVNTYSASAGDQILFKKGDEFNGTLTVPSSGSSGNPIIYGAYGTGDNPIFKGSSEVTGWTLHSGNIYKATVAEGFNSLFLDGVKVPISRFPSSGIIQVDTVTSSTIFSASELDNGTDWTGATLLMDFDSYAYQKRLITASSAAQITVDSALLNLTVNDKFYLLNKLEAIDGANQYAWDDATNTLYLWTPDSDSPALHTVEVSTIDNAVVIADKSYVTIQDIDFKEFDQDAILISGVSTNLIVEDGVFTDNYANAINFYDADTSNITVQNNTISNSLSHAIKCLGGSHVISGNTISDIGRSGDLGIDGFVDFLSSAVAILGYPISNTTINNNVINSIGYIGILFYGQDVAVEQNKVYDFCLDRQDGGGIYTHKVENDNIIIQDNIVYNTTPAPQGVSGIYLDAITNDVSVIDNTVWNCYYGIQTNNLKGCTFTGNTLYGNSDQQFLTREFFADSNEAPNVISDNVMISLLTTPPNTIYPWARTIGDMYLTVNNNVIGQDRANPILYYETAPEGGGGEIYSWITIAQFAAKLTASNVGTTPIIPDYTKTELFYNSTSVAVAQDLSGHANWTDLSGNAVTSLTLQPFTSQVLNYSD